jgi:hypothetical protein
MIQSIHHYGIDTDQMTQDFGEITVTAAIAAINEKYNNLRSYYENEEIALTETMFGFSRSNSDFIEISLHTRNEIHFKYERALTKRFLLFQKLFVHEDIITNLQTLVDRTKRFFEMKADDFQSYLESLKSQ